MRKNMTKILMIGYALMIFIFLSIAVSITGNLARASRKKPVDVIPCIYDHDCPRKLYFLERCVGRVCKYL
uniref:Nodule-specific cysteine-rich peptide 303 n=1 Tax=Medicago truncatula TaxID=3880 RepID=A7KHD8_MEDTR|nr:nodule-specific cysteine-rich peptide 303 [Medicago truncatula]